MEITHQNVASIAQQYFGTTTALTRLGWGLSGYVYLSPDLRTAVKIHLRAESFANELSVYQRLQSLKITSLMGLTIPKLRGHNFNFNLISMDVVDAPYLLDFAGASFKPPDFAADTMASWRAQIEEFFGPNSHFAYSIYEILRRHGIYYMDFRPSNMNLTNHPEAEPYNPADSDNF